jgi:hypothetical protein
MPARKPRSPQEKKRLSCSRDRRNYYGENDKSSRKNIARHKRRRHRAERHGTRQQLAAAAGPAGGNAGALVQDRVPRRPRQGDRWRKLPDVPLGSYVASRLQRRIDAGSSATETEQARIGKIRRSTNTDGRQRRRKWIR